MDTIEVRPARWAEFFTKVQERATGATIRLSAVNPEGANRDVAQSTSLRRIQWDPESDACNSLLRIEYGSGDGDGGKHEVLEPIRVKLRREQNGTRDFRTMEILAENGTTVVEFRPPLQASVVEGLSFSE